YAGVNYDNIVADPDLYNEASRSFSIGGSNDVLQGTTSSDMILGGAGGDQLYGLGSTDLLIGATGTDTLDGGTGADRMIGGANDDTYYIDNVGDVVIEAANEGNDIVRSSIDFTLPTNFESVVLIEGAGNINGAGNSAVNALVGNTGNNTLDGKGGNDTMRGGGG